MKKTLIVIRHAHRNVIDPSDNNGLSEKGKLQAIAIRDHFKKNYTDKEVALFSSPRLRCQETLEPLAKGLKLDIEILDLLDEGAQIKSGGIDKRIQKFIKWWKDEAGEFSVICSHGDWIPLFFEAATGDEFNLKKAGWAELKFKNDQISLEEVIQSWQIES